MSIEDRVIDFEEWVLKNEMDYDLTTDKDESGHEYYINFQTEHVCTAFYAGLKHFGDGWIDASVEPTIESEYLIRCADDRRPLRIAYSLEDLIFEMTCKGSRLLLQYKLIDTEQ